MDTSHSHDPVYERTKVDAAPVRTKPGIERAPNLTETAPRSGKIISIISNKGGVGKTIFSIETANVIGKTGKRVLLIDTDINTGDISSKLSLHSSRTLLDFFDKTENDFKKLIIRKHHFDLIPGAGGNFKFANINYFQKLKFIQSFKKVAENYDYTILDLGAGIDRTTLDFALTADYPVIITTPEDVQSGYGCAKAAAERYIELEMKLQQKHPGYRINRNFTPLFVFNRCNADIAYGIFQGIKRAVEITRNRSGICIQPGFLGSIINDYRRVGKSYYALHAPISEIFPDSSIGRSYDGIARYFLRTNTVRDDSQFISPLVKILRLFQSTRDEAKA